MNIGINKVKFVNVLVIFSLLFLFLQIFLNALIVPKTLDSARDYIRNSKVDFFPNLIKEKKFIDVVKNLTISVSVIKFSLIDLTLKITLFIFDDKNLLLFDALNSFICYVWLVFNFLNLSKAFGDV